MDVLKPQPPDWSNDDYRDDDSWWVDVIIDARDLSNETITLSEEIGYYDGYYRPGDGSAWRLGALDVFLMRTSHGQWAVTNARALRTLLEDVGQAPMEELSW